ncbi:MAG: class I tRNA ligase family protein, partial [Candidatus Binataceae bacterium]
NVTYLSGTDEHGDKIRRAAIAEGMTPKAYTDKMSALFHEAFVGLNTSFDYWVRTTDEVHEKFVQRMLTASYQRDNIYFTEYEGLYCVGCERFYTEKELLPGNLCPTHNTVVEAIKEGNYFLKIDKYREQVLDHIRRNPDFIRPERYRNEALNMLAEPLSDLCISRPKARMNWGIELPFDSNYVTYVWYDAFWTYVSKPATDLGLEQFQREIWPHTEHFIGKDILKTHAVYWPPMLLAAGWDQFFKHLNVHGWLNFGGSRMSKSSGNVRDPVSYEKAYGPDVLRYFVMREMAYGLDGDFSDDRMTERYNADLANDLGNFTSRVLTMAQRYLGGELSSAPSPGTGDLDRGLAAAFADLPERVGAFVEELAFNRALEAIWQALDVANKYVAATAPFTLAKDPANQPRIAQILANLLEGLRVVTGTLEPFMPVTAAKLITMLNVGSETANLPYGEGLKPGHKVNPPTALFPRIDTKARG